MLGDIKQLLARPMVPRLLCLVLLILLIVQIYTETMAFFSLEKTLKASYAKAAPVKNKVKTDPLKKILDVAFFGAYIPKTINAAGVKQSMLDLKVVGVMFSTPDKSSHAMIKTAGGQERLFGVGDKLPGGAVIKRITPDGVLIEHNGTLESLSLAKEELKFDSPPSKPLRQDEESLDAQ